VIIRPPINCSGLIQAGVPTVTPTCRDIRDALTLLLRAEARRRRTQVFADPVALARAAGVTLDGWQRDTVTSLATERLMLCPRQTGKSLAAAVLALHTAVTDAGSLTLVVATAQRQAAELFLKVKTLLAALGQRAPAIQRESALALTTTAGRRIVVIPGEGRTVRGFSSVRLLVLDEAARIEDALYQALRPMLAVSRGTVLALSTPAGRRGWFHHEWTEGGPRWHRATVTAEQCPRLSPEWLAAERERIGSFWWRQEYLCQWLDADDQVFR
jgi:terminase large subunit-like protein